MPCHDVNRANSHPISLGFHPCLPRHRDLNGGFPLSPSIKLSDRKTPPRRCRRRRRVKWSASPTDGRAAQTSSHFVSNGEGGDKLARAGAAAGKTRADVFDGGGKSPTPPKWRPQSSKMQTKTSPHKASGRREGAARGGKRGPTFFSPRCVMRL